MFKDSCAKIRAHSNLPIFHSKQKYDNTVVYSVNSSCLFSTGKQEKSCWNNSLIKSSVYLIIFRKKSMIFLKGVLIDRYNSFAWVWPRKAWYKTATLTKSEVKRQFLNYFWFHPLVLQGPFQAFKGASRLIFYNIRKYTFIPSFTKRFEIMVAETLGKNLGPPMPKRSNDSYLQ